ncbi:MAG: hypothetical protein Q9222_002931, partial [Ikaeria aurantiellina]
KETNTIFDLQSSSELSSLNAGDLDEDEDELSFHARAARPARNKSAKGGGGTKKKGGKATSGAKQGGGKGKRISTTYTRKPVAEQENADHIYSDGGVGNDDDDEEEGDQNPELPVMTGRAREEMKKMAAKFREVDDWGLEFEEVTGSSGRMRDAR